MTAVKTLLKPSLNPEHICQCQKINHILSIIYSSQLPTNKKTPLHCIKKIFLFNTAKKRPPPKTKKFIVLLIYYHHHQFIINNQVESIVYWYGDITPLTQFINGGATGCCTSTIFDITWNYIAFILQFYYFY